MRSSKRVVLSIPALALVAGVVAYAPGIRAQGPAPTSFDECDLLVRERPDDGRVYECYRDVGIPLADLAGAQRRLEALAATHPDRPWIRFHLALVAWDRQDRDAAIRALDEAAEGFERDGEAAAAVDAHVKSAQFLTDLRRIDDALAALDRATALADDTDDDDVRARVLVQRGWTAIKTGRYADADLHLRRAERLVFPDGRAVVRKDVLGGLAAVEWLTGRRAQADLHYRLAIDLLGDLGREEERVFLLGNRLGLTEERYAAGEVPESEATAIARETLEAAARINQFLVMARAHSGLAKYTDGDEAIGHAHAAVEAARRWGHPHYVRGACRESGYRLIQLDPARADEGFALLDEAAPPPDARPDERIRQAMLVASAHMVVSEKERVVQEFEWLFETLEQVRDLQHDDDARAGTFAAFSDQYLRLASYLLDAATEGGSAPRPGDVDLALATVERMRARSLLDHLDAAGAGAALAPGGPLAARRDGVLDEIAAVQRSLREEGLPEGERRVRLGRLEGLELEERELRLAIARDDPAFAALRVPRFPPVDEVADALADDEALLSLHTAIDAHGGSRAIAIWRDGLATRRLPDRVRLERETAFLLGLLHRRDGTDALAAARLGAGLLGDILGDLPVRIRRLVVVPDGPLWGIPFGALRMSHDGPPLAASHEIALVPSATLWLRLRERGGAEPVVIPAIALADPDLGEETDEAATYGLRDWSLERGITLGRLPRARGEARAMVRRLGGASVLRVAGEASEGWLKSAPLQDARVLHFATHAVVDDARPDRSAVVLAPGGDDEDGLLQPREIVELDLDGAIVLLTACRSASGSVLGGEGPMSLARAFFQAGASAVVGGLWPLRDDDAADLVDRLSVHLARGAPVGSALAAARRDLIAGGRPAEAWSGLVLIGDGAAVARRPGPPPGPGPIGPGALLASAVGLAIVVLGIARRRGARAS